MRRAALLLAYAAFILGCLEIGLRMAPHALVPLNWLKRFEPGIRSEIAQAMGLPRQDVTYELERDDGGPPLLLYKPFARTEQPMAPGVVDIVERDDQGFCNPPEDSYARDQIDVLIIGDSFSTCILNRPEEGWPHLLGQALGNSLYGLGRPGTGPYEYVQILKAKGLAKQPRLVVMSFYEGNDLRDALRYRAFRDGARSDTSNDDRDRFEPDYERLLGNPIGRSSYAANLLLVAWGKLQEAVLSRLQTEEAGERRDVNFLYTLERDGKAIPFNEQNADQSEVRQALSLAAGDFDLTVLDGAIEAFASLAAAHDFIPVIVYAPSAHTVYAKEARYDDPSLADVLSRHSADQRGHLADLTRKLGIIFFDMTDPLRRAVAETELEPPLYSPITLHYSVAGNATVAEIMVPQLAPLLLP